MQQLETCLSFIAFNYEIKCLENVFKKKKVADWSSLCPPFAILTMHKIEVEALKILQEQQNFSPKIYKRYIDDIIIVPVERTDIAEKIL